MDGVVGLKALQNLTRMHCRPSHEEMLHSQIDPACDPCTRISPHSGVHVSDFRIIPVCDEENGLPAHCRACPVACLDGPGIDYLT